jgi:integrase
MMALTDTEVRKAKPAAAQYKIGDGGGLYIAVTPQGGKIWRWKYRFEGTEQSLSFGRYPDVCLAQARELHAANRKMLASGVNPAVRRRVEKAPAENSFETIANRWIEHWKDDKSPRHVDSTRRRLVSNIMPYLGKLPVTVIVAPDIVKMVRGVEERGARDVAKRALETTGQIFRYAIAHGYAERNPASEIRPRDILRATVRTNYARVDARDVPELLRAIEVYRGSHVTRLAMKLMALTFVRTSELIGGRWDEIDWDAKRWNIPAERMKMKTPHIVPLAAQTIEVLRLLHKITGGGPLLFPGDRNPLKSMSNNTILYALKRMGYGGVMTGHGFRGLASTLLHEQGFGHDHIELQLAHSQRNSVSAAYNHALYLAPRDVLMQHWADYLEQAQRGGNVIPFRAGAA